MRRMPDPKYPLRLRCQAARILADMKQTDLADEMGDGYERSTISNMERGLKKIGSTDLIRWSRATGVPLEFFTLDIDGLAGEAPKDPYAALEDLDKRIAAARKSGVA